MNGATKNEGVVQQQQELANSPMQKFEQAIARTGDLLNTLATVSLPMLTPLLSTLDTMLGQLITTIQGLQADFQKGPAWMAHQIINNSIPDPMSGGLKNWWHDLFNFKAVTPGQTQQAGGSDPGLIHQESYTPGGPTVVIQGLTINGAGQSVKEYARMLADHIAEELSRTQINNLGMGRGSYSSPYQAGI
jgi:hypothetical protein